MIEHSPGLRETAMTSVQLVVSSLTEGVSNTQPRLHFPVKANIRHVPLCFSKKGLLFRRPIEDSFN